LSSSSPLVFLLNATLSSHSSPLSLHDALPISVTNPFLPPKEEYKTYIEDIWMRQWLTNMGPLASDLEMRLKAHLNVKHLLFVTKDRKSTRLNSSHVKISYAVYCLKQKNSKSAS